jgi:hypothetical protein
MTEINFNIVCRGGVDEPTAICAVCVTEGAAEDDARFPLEEILGHLAGAHGLDIEIQCWPDGNPVVVDLTLEPDDFAR